jgi:hypothetical protein
MIGGPARLVAKGTNKLPGRQGGDL